jgi:hypothetical protein
MASLLVPANVVDISQVITNPGAVSNLGVQAAATKPLVVIRVIIELAQATIPTAANARVRLVRKTAAPTGTTAIAATTFLNHDPTEPDASFTAGHTATGEGTDGDFIERGWGSSTGWLFDWNATPEEYIVVAAGTGNGLWIKHNVAPPAGNYSFTMTVGELG